MAERPVSVPPAVLRAGAAGPGLSPTRRLRAWLDRQSPWRRRAIAFLLGALAAAALPPVYALPVLIVSFSGLVLLMDRTPRPVAAVGLGWCFAFGYFVAGIYWVANALLSVPSAFGWLLPFAIAGAVGGLSALMAAFPALAIGLARALWPAGPARILVLAIAWTLFDWLRSWVLTGVWGLSLVTVIAAALPALLLDWDGRGAADASPRRRGAAESDWIAGSLA